MNSAPETEGNWLLKGCMLKLINWQCFVSWRS